MGMLLRHTVSRIRLIQSEMFLSPQGLGQSFLAAEGVEHIFKFVFVGLGLMEV